MNPDTNTPNGPAPGGAVPPPQMIAPLPPVQRPKGEVNPFIITTIILTLLTIGLSGFGVWAYINYSDQKNNVDDKIDVAVADAKRAQTLDDEAKFAEREKEPYIAFVGPDDLGRVTFNYPKSWSSYVARDSRSGGEMYQAILHPGVIPPLDSNTFYALRLSIIDDSYDKVVGTFSQKVKSGDLKSSAITIEGETGTRLDGNFTKDMQGSAVFFKVRDKTLKLQTESKVFQSDFDKIILASLTFNK